jgi:hypothetical protein
MVPSKRLKSEHEPSRESSQDTRSPELSPDLPGEPKSARELVKRIRKLRWMGMEEEAQRLQAALRRIEDTDCVLAAPRDTD